MPTMTPAPYDAIIIGTGQAGPSLAARSPTPGRKSPSSSASCSAARASIPAASPPRPWSRAPMPPISPAARPISASRSNGRRQRGHEARESAQGRHLRQVANRRRELAEESAENCTVYQGHARFESASRGRRRGCEAHGRRKSSSTSAGAPSFPQMPGLDRCRTSPTAR